MDELDKSLDKVRDNVAITDAFMKADSVINNPAYERVSVSVSGGADSDIMMDLITKVDRSRKCRFVFFDTGMEYQATKDHLVYLEDRYQREIVRRKAVEPIPLAVKRHGVPFLTKIAAEKIHKLQKAGFGWEIGNWATLNARYPHAKDPVGWWTDEWVKIANEKKGRKDKTSIFTISRHKGLREFMHDNPPDFEISSMCCTYVKKKTGHEWEAESGAQLEVVGMRKAEGGARSSLKGCFSPRSEKNIDRYRPLFWFSDKDKETYEERFGVIHSRCYTEYGMKRTGCAGCPFNSRAVSELETVEKYEPKLVKACRGVFGKAYDYTAKYRAFADDLKRKERLEAKFYEDPEQIGIQF